MFQVICLTGVIAANKAEEYFQIYKFSKNMDLKHFIFDFQKDPNHLQFSQTLHVLQDQKHRLGQSADHSQQSY